MLDVRNDQRAERERGRSANNSRCCCAHTASSSGPRCSRNVPSTLLIAPAEPGPEGLPGACQLQLGPGQLGPGPASGLPVGCLPPQLCRPPHHCLAAHCWPCLLGPCCSGCIPARVSFSPLALGGVRGCWGCCAWRWLGAETWVEIFEWSTGFEFLAVSALPPAAFRCQLNRQRQSRDPGGPDRTLVCIQPTPSAQAVPSPTKPLPKKR